MKNFPSSLIAIFLSVSFCVPLYAAEIASEYQYDYDSDELPPVAAAAPVVPAVHAAPAAPVEPPVPAGESEKAKDWKGIQAQEQWVARLKKQIDGETRQLSEMRAALAEKNKLDPKKFEAGIYEYDPEKDAFVER